MAGSSGSGQVAGLSGIARAGPGPRTEVLRRTRPPRTEVLRRTRLPGLKPWVMIGRKWSGGGAACSGKWTEVHAAAVPPMIGSVCQGGGAQVPGLKSAAIGHSCPMAMG